MATVSIPYTFTNVTQNADATQVNANFSALATFANSELLQRDGSIALTAGSFLSLSSSTPTADNHAARKAYVDSIVPAGTIHQYAGSTAPNSMYLLCQGQAVSRATYATLFAVIGVTYGVGDGTTTFNLPNLQGRIPVGYDSTQTEFNTLAKTGGEKTHVLTTAELPLHQHALDHDHASATVTVADHANVVNRLASFSDGGFATGINTTPWAALSPPGLATTSLSSVPTAGMAVSYSTYSHTASVDLPNFTGTSGSVGSGTAHNVLQPYVVVNYIIKAV